MTGVLASLFQGKAITLGYKDFATDVFLNATHTFSNLSVGEAVVGRNIIVCVAWKGAVTLSSLTIGGSAGTVHNQVQRAADTNVAMCSIQSDTGTTKTVVLTFSGATDAYTAVAVYSETGGRVFNIGSTDNTGLDMNLNTNVVAGGIAVGCAYADNGSYSSKAGFTTDDTPAQLLNAFSDPSILQNETPRTYTLTYTVGNVVGAIAYFQ